jgi:hypothetical protein
MDRNTPSPQAARATAKLQAVIDYLGKPLEVTDPQQHATWARELAWLMHDVRSYRVKLLIWQGTVYETFVDITAEDPARVLVATPARSLAIAAGELFCPGQSPQEESLGRYTVLIFPASS